MKKLTLPAIFAVLTAAAVPSAVAAQRPTISIPPPLPPFGQYALTCGISFADFRYEKLTATYWFRKGTQSIAFAAPAAKYELPVEPVSLKLYSDRRPLEGSVKTDNGWLNFEFDGLFPVVSKKFHFVIYRETEPAGHMGRDLDSIFATAICERKFEGVNE